MLKIGYNTPTLAYVKLQTEEDTCSDCGPSFVRLVSCQVAQSGNHRAGQPDAVPASGALRPHEVFFLL